MDGTLIFYHFTSTAHLERIMAEGRIRPTESNVSGFRAHAGPDVVWLTDLGNARGEKGLEGSGVDKKAVRFTVDVPALRWRDWEPAARMDQHWRKTLISTGGGDRVSGHWYVWPGEIPFTRWVQVHVRGQLYMQRDDADEVLPRGERVPR